MQVRGATLFWEDLTYGMAKLRCRIFVFADDIVSFEKSFAETVLLFPDLVAVLSQVPLIHNASNTGVSTNEAQPPQHLQ